MLRRKYGLMGTVALALAAMTGLWASSAAQDKTTLIIYSARNSELIEPLFKVYTQETGVVIKSHTDKDGALIQRLKAEGSSSPADILLTVDAGNLWQAAAMGLFHPLNSKKLEGAIPASYRDPQNRWFGFSLRARTIAYNTDKVRPEDLSTYEDLASSKWKGRLILRTSKKVYSQSLVASMVAALGEKKIRAVVEGWVTNLAADVFSSDTKVLEAIAAGQGDVGIVNTYYYGRLMKESPHLPLKLFWPNQDKGQRGVHVNVSGAGVVASSKNKKEAQAFLEWLATEKAQRLFVDINMEYPAARGVKPSSEVAAWGEFRADPLNVAQVGQGQAGAIVLMNKAGYH